MPQSLSAVHVHLVFSTKERRAFLRDEGIRLEMHAYLGGVSRVLECPPVAVGGVADHVHVLARLGRTMTQSGWVKELKRASSLWIKQKGTAYAGFQWQAGFACFGVSRSGVAEVAAYVANQAAKHGAMSFEDELRALLRRHEVDFDERFLWD